MMPRSMRMSTRDPFRFAERTSVTSDAELAVVGISLEVKP
jgi:hypothetical protein